MAYEIILCKHCNGSEVVRYGTQSGCSRFRCKECGRIFKTDYVYRAHEPGVKDQIVDIAMNGDCTDFRHRQIHRDFDYNRTYARC